MGDLFCTYLAEFVAFEAANCGQYPRSESDRVIYKHTEAALGEWMSRINHQRRALDAGQDSDLSLQEVEMLNQVGFLWNVGQDVRWDINYNKLCEYYEQEGHSNVPYRHGTLGRWVGVQRTIYKAFIAGKCSNMTNAKIAKLRSIEFEWAPKKDVKSAWSTKIELLSDFKREHGHCDVPQSYIDSSLAIWTKKQRSLYKAKMAGEKSPMSDDRIEQLNKLGFKWAINKKGKAACN